MELRIDGHLYLRICRFGINHPEGFKIQTLLDELKIEDNSWEVLTINLYATLALLTARINVNSTRSAQTYNPEYDSLFHVIKRSNDFGDIENFDISRSLTSTDIHRYYFILKASSVFEYLDYLEFTEAKETAKSSLIKANESIDLAKKSIKISHNSIDIAKKSLWIGIFSSLAASIISVGTCIISSKYSETQINLANEQLKNSQNPLTIDPKQINQFLIEIDSVKLEMNKNIKRIENKLDKAQKNRK